MVSIHWDPLKNEFVVRLELGVTAARNIARSQKVPDSMVADLTAAAELAEKRNRAISPRIRSSVPREARTTA